jgi:carbon-monoxide dehydrogenase medium subunit
VAHRPQLFPELCDPDASPAEIGAAYADAIEPIGDARGSSGYRKRVIAVEVRRALEEIAA